MNGMKLQKQIVIHKQIAGKLSPFAQQGGMGKVHQLFGAELPKVLEAMNRELAA